MRSSFHKSGGHGFSLIEVLIAVVVMSFGLLALAALQSTLTRNSSESKAQSIALELARQKIEDLKSFKLLNEPTTTCVAANDSYQCITDSTAAESLSDSSGSLGGVNFTRSWDVQRCTLVSGAFACSDTGVTSAYTATTPRNEFKTLSVTVNWVDASGASRTVKLKDTVSALQPSDASLINKPSTSITPRFARARIADPGSADGVIPIAVGGGSNTAATNPKPEVIVGTSVVETRFDVLTYAGLNNGSAEAQARVETAVVGCTCDFGQAPTSTTARGKRPTYWNGSRYSVPEDTTTVPPAGEANVTQSDLCEACCRDHHDPSGTTTPKFSPYLSSHAHYNSPVTGSPAVTSGQYKEACRLIRVDGIFRVATDLYNDYFALLATEDLSDSSDYATTSIPDETAITRYQNFVVDYMDERFTTASSTTNYNVPSSVEVYGDTGLEEANELNEPDEIDIAKVNDVRWLHARGLMVDYLEQEAIDAVTQAKTGCSSQSGSGLSDCVLKYLPFTSINLTELANWNSEATAEVVVTNSDYSSSLTESDPVRGKVSSGTSPTNNAEVDVNTLSRKSNSGLLDLAYEAISPSDAVTLSDAQQFETISGVPGGDAGDGTFYANLTMPSGYPTQTPGVVSKVSTLNSEACNVGSPVTNNTCFVTKGTASAGLGFADTMSVIVSNYNHQVNGTTTASITCTGTSNAATFAAKSTTQSRTTKTCKNYEVTAATNTSTGTAATSFNTLTNSTLQDETTQIYFPLINNGNTVGITFGLQSSDPQSTTCTYYCTQLSNDGTDCKSDAKTVFQFTTADCP